MNRLRPIGEGELPAEFLTDQNAQAQGEPVHPQPHLQQGLERATASMFLAGLRTLSQRALSGIVALFVLLTAASAWWLWLVTLPTPSVPQLIGLSLYGVLILALNYLVLRRR